MIQITGVLKRRLAPDARVGPQAAARVARAEIHGPLEPGEHDRGELVFAPPPLVAGGRVVDGLGDPVAGANVSVETKLLDEDGGEHAGEPA